MQNVRITATNTDTSIARTEVTDGAGRFTLAALPVGTYILLAEAPHFSPQKFENLLLTVGSLVELSVVMQVAGSTQLTVFAVSDPQRTAIVSTVSQQQIDNLPINGRNFVAFSLITPGVSTDRTPVQGSSATSGLSFAGQSARSNNIMVDGLDNTEAALGSARATFSQEAVREFQVLTNSFSAEFGKATGGVINILTKSGTNSFSGNLFLYLRDRALNSKAYFERFSPAGESIERPKGTYSQNQFGGTFGGPLRKNRTFFFASFERLQIATSNFVNIDDSTLVPDPFGGPPLGTPAAILRRAGFQFELGNVLYEVRGDQFLVKIDHHINRRHNLSVRFNYADGSDENAEPYGGIVARSRAGRLESTDYGLTASHAAVVSSQLLSEMRFQFASRSQDVFPLDPTCGGPCVTENQGGPTIEVAGVAALGRHRAMPQPRSADRYQVTETLTYVHGRQRLKAGGDFSFIHNESSIPLHFGGRYIFAAAPALPGLRPALSSIQAVALGLPAVYLQGYGNSRGDYGYKDVSVFAENEWSARRNVTVKVGLRYQKQFWEVVQSHDPILGNYPFPADNNNLAPRLAVAWNPRSDRKTFLHAAYGVFFGNHITTISSSVKIFDGAIGARTLVLLGPGAVGAWISPGRRLPEPETPFPSLRFVIDPDLKGTYTSQLSIGVDRELPAGITASANVVYARGRNHLGSIDYNPLVPELGQGRRPYDVNGRPGTSASVIQFTSYGESRYGGFVLSVGRRFSDRYHFLASYTLSKAKDNTIDFQSQFLPQFNGRGRNRQAATGLPETFDPQLDYGPSQQDQRHRFVVSGTYIAPLRIQLSSILTAASGRPYNILAGSDFNQDGDATNDRARGNPSVGVNDYTTTVGRNAGTMPLQVVLDLRVSRKMRLGQALHLEALVDVFNLFNRPNFTEINNIFGRGSYPTAALPSFGQFTQAAAPRQVQIAVKLTF